MQARERRTAFKHRYRKDFRELESERTPITSVLGMPEPRSQQPEQTFSRFETGGIGHEEPVRLQS